MNQLKSVWRKVSFMPA